VKLFGFEVARIKAQTLSAVDSMRGWFGLIHEAWGGAWQQDITVDGQKDILAFSAVFSCVTVIASDIAKLRIKLVEEDDDGICTEVKPGSPFLPVLRKPNKFQTRVKFIEQWIVSKLLYGNTYALKARDQRGIVVALYILDAQRVTPLVAENGDVYYQLSRDDLSKLPEQITVPASEIIHDTMVCLWHPLIGVSPIYACGLSATQGRRIQLNSTKFFGNASRPSGVLVVPGSITDQDANALKARWEENYGSGQTGRTAVLGGGLKYEAMAIPAQDAQLIEQLRWTVEDVARCFHMPLFKIGGPVPPQTSVEALQQAYYADCLQALIESAEAKLDEGLNLPENYYTDFDLDGLLRMDTAARYDAKNKAVAGGWMSPNEARRGENLKPVKGGESPMVQQQYYNLEALAKRDASNDPFGTAKPAPAANDDAGAERASAAKRLKTKCATEPIPFAAIA
jgi:HK97 family phage portal protein